MLDSARERGGPLALAFLLIIAVFAVVGAEELLTAVLTGNPPRSPSGVWAAIAATALAGFVRQVYKDMHRREVWDEASGFSWGLVAGFLILGALVLVNRGFPTYYSPFMERVLPGLFFSLSAYVVLVWLPVAALIRSSRIDESRERLAARRAAGLSLPSAEEFRLEARAQSGKWILLKSSPESTGLSEKLGALVQDGFRDYDEVRIRRTEALV
jgi:hypothetical protein